MKIPLLRSGDVVAGSEIFRVASLLLYTTLLLHVVLAAYGRHLMLSDISILAMGLLALLFSVSLARVIWPQAIVSGQRHLLVELAAATSVIVMFSLQRSMPALPMPWVIGVAGLFPLVLEGGVALIAVAVIALAGYGLNASLGMHVGDWLPQMFATVFVGLLSILLAKTLNLNVSAVQKARTNERRFDAIARATRHVFMITDAHYRVKYANPALQEVIGYTRQEIEELSVEPVVHPDDVDEHRNKLRYLRSTPRSSIVSRHRTQHKDGHWVWLETSGYNMLHDSAIDGLVFSIEDVTPRKDAELKLEEEHALLRAVLDLNPSMIYAKDAEGRFTISNLSFQRRFGYSSEEELRGKTSYEVYLMQATEGQELDAYEIADEIHLQDLHVIETGLPLQDLEVQGFWQSDVRRWYRTNKYPLRDANGKTVGVLGITRDITDRKEYEMRLEHQALHDSLTGLPNRRYLLNTIGVAINEFRRKPVNLTILFCDLDFFKSVNDTHGHDFGDKCLMEMTRRILAAVPTQDFVARFGGNEFVVLTNAPLSEAAAKAEALMQAVSQRLIIDDVAVKIQTSIGIAQLNADHSSPSELIRDADAAMYQAKERGRNRAEIYDASLQSLATKRAQMDVALRFALERDELTVVYQPKVSILDGTVKGFELLLRWNSPQYGEISPTEFIPIAETSGLVVPIGLWALEEACKQLAAWQKKYPALDHVTIAVNVSMRQLLQTSFLPEVTRILDSSRVLPHTVELELTETSAMANPVQTIENLSLLKKLGVRLALDDFGTGYSSLAYLQKLPIDVLKIDKAFVHGLGTNQGDAEIVRLVLALAQTLNLETVAEGVETQEHIAELKKMGCFLAQGFVFSPAVSAEEAEQLLCSSRRYLIE
jgi:diguanylate cyclase (GGDEF)-like protein/PAS domain S-box-containing protein